MGEALITRRGGFNISELADCQTYHMESGNAVPTSIDMNKIKAYIAYVTDSARGAISIFTNTGDIVLSSGEDDSHILTSIDIDTSTRKVKTNGENLSASERYIAVVY